MKRILYISNYRKGLGGISAQVDLLCSAVNAEQTALQGKSEEVKDKSAYQADIFSTKGNPVKRLWLFVKLLWVARKYDVLHIHGCSDWGMLPVVYGVIAGKLWRKNTVVTYHGGGADEYFSRHGAFARRWLNRADTVIVLNGYLKKVFDEYGIKNIVVPNIAKLSDAQEHSVYQWEAPRLISVRHLHPLYNIPCILKTFAIVKEQVPGARLTILGDGPQRHELEQLVDELRAKSEDVRGKSEEVRDSGVRFVGQVKNKEIGRYLAESDIMLSAPHIDNMPVSLMEAMNAGTLVISSRVGGVPFMITDGENGLLFEDDSAEEMASRIMQAIENPKGTERMIANAKNDVQKYSWKNVRKSLLPIYDI